MLPGESHRDHNRKTQKIMGQSRTARGGTRVNYIERHIAIILLVQEGYQQTELDSMSNAELGVKFTSAFYFLDSCFFIF